MTTTVSMARPDGGAGPNRQEQPMDYRAIERAFDAAATGRITRDDQYEYVNTGNHRIISDAVYAAEQRGFLHLTYDGSVTVTAEGVAWRCRERKRARSAPAAAAVFSDSGQVA